MPDNSKGLLDMMLEESARTAASEGADTRPIAASSEPEEEPEAAWPNDVEQLMELNGGDLRTWLAAVAPNDLLCVVAEGSEAFKTRMLGQLDGDSVKWLKGNIELWDPATEALKASSRNKVLVVARGLIAEGKIALPESAERVGKDQDDVNDEARAALATTLVQLVAVAHEAGIDALAEVADEAGHPMLEFGLKCLVEGQRRDPLEDALEERKSTLEASYRAELELIRQTILAMARGDDPKTFLSRLEATYR